MFSEMKRNLAQGNKIVVSGFGSFYPYVTKAKKCRNPKTGETIHISPRNKVRFHQSKDLF